MVGLLNDILEFSTMLRSVGQCSEIVAQSMVWCKGFGIERTRRAGQDFGIEKKMLLLDFGERDFKSGRIARQSANVEVSNGGGSSFGK